MASAAIAIDENNWIDNSGTIVGYYGGISDNGNDVITNSGRISSTFTPAVNEDAGGNKISNTGLISENSVGAAIDTGGRWQSNHQLRNHLGQWVQDIKSPATRNNSINNSGPKSLRLLVFRDFRSIREHSNGVSPVCGDNTLSDGTTSAANTTSRTMARYVVTRQCPGRQR